MNQTVDQLINKFIGLIIAMVAKLVIVDKRQITLFYSVECSLSNRIELQFMKAEFNFVYIIN